MNHITEIFLLILASYIVGSIPTGVWISKIFFGFDVRTKGSGNMGSTNVFRVLGTKWGIIVQLVDILKGVIPVVFFCSIIFGNALDDLDYFNRNQIYFEVIAGAAAVLGHIFPVFMQFKGGKGINTATGMLIGVAPIEVGIGVLVFLLVLFSSGYISLSSISTSFAIPIIMLVRKYIFEVQIRSFEFLMSFFVLLMITVLITHRSNIKRLLNGEENKFQKLHLIKFNRS